MVNRHKRTIARDADSKRAKTAKSEEPGQDHFSSLHKNCLLDVLSKVDHNDLDEIAVLSVNLDGLADISRSKAEKVHADDLFVSQVNANEFHFRIGIGNTTWTLKLKKSTRRNLEKIMFKRCSGNDITKNDENLIPQQQTISGMITDQAIALLSRFNIESCTFYSVSIDNNFLAFMKSIVSSSNPLRHISLKHCKFDDSLSINGRQDFHATLLSAKPSYIAVNSGHDTFIDGSFLEEYTQTVRNAFVDLNQSNRGAPEQHFERRLTEVLPSFICLSLSTLFDNMIVDAAGLMSSIFTRLRRRKNGRWSLNISRTLNREEIEATLPADLTYWRENDAEIIQEHPTGASVTFACNATAHPWVTFEADFHQ